MDPSQDATSMATAAATEPLSEGVFWGQESIISPEKVYTVTEDGYELVKQQLQQGHHVHYRVLFIGSGLQNHKDKVLKRITEAVAHLYSANDDKRVFVIGADLTSSNDEDLKAYLNRVNNSGNKIDLVIYLFDNHTADDPLQHLLVLENHLSNVPIWPLLTHASSDKQQQQQQQQQQHALTRHLPTYPHIRTVNVSRIHPERSLVASSKKSPQNNFVLTVEQFQELNPEDIAHILEGWSIDAGYEAREEDVIVVPNAPVHTPSTKSNVGIYGILAVAILAGVWKLVIRHELAALVFVQHQAPPTVQAELNPTWQAIDERTLQHPFQVQIDRGDKEDLTIMVQANDVDLEYPMVYEQGSEFKYTAEVPSPCLLDSDKDIEATVIWRSDDGVDKKVEKVIDQVLLRVDVCKPVQERRLREEKKRTGVMAVGSLPLDITWQLLIDKLVSRSHRVVQTFADAWHTLVGIWQRS